MCFKDLGCLWALWGRSSNLYHVRARLYHVHDLSRFTAFPSKQNLFSGEKRTRDTATTPWKGFWSFYNLQNCHILAFSIIIKSHYKHWIAPLSLCSHILSKESNFKKEVQAINSTNFKVSKSEPENRKLKKSQALTLWTVCGRTTLTAYRQMNPEYISARSGRVKNFCKLSKPSTW